MKKLNQIQIQKNNRLIALFMDWKQQGYYKNFMVSPIDGHYDDSFPNNLAFHESWDWLMPVV
jgi:hypothetical protein